MCYAIGKISDQFLQFYMMKKYSAIIVFLAILQSGVAQTERINFKASWSYPEGIAFDKKNNVFYVSSAKTGTIGKVSMHGKYDSILVDSSLKSSFGLKFDEQKNILWACAGDPNYSKYSDSSTYQKTIRVIAVDVAARKKIKEIDLSMLYPGRHFANDLAIDNGGNIYITNSYSPVVYKIDSSGKASVFAESPLFKGSDIGLNGIAFHSSGFLLVANNSSGRLLKVDIKDPKNISAVAMDHFFPGADGLLWDDKNNLVLIQNKGVNMVYNIASSDQWKTATIIATTRTTDRFAQPSTGVAGGGKVYVLNSKLNELNDPTAQLSKEFSIQLVRFVPQAVR